MDGAEAGVQALLKGIGGANATNPGSAPQGSTSGPGARGPTAPAPRADLHVHLLGTGDVAFWTAQLRQIQEMTESNTRGRADIVSLLSIGTQEAFTAWVGDVLASEELASALFTLQDTEPDLLGSNYRDWNAITWRLRLRHLIVRALCGQPVEDLVAWNAEQYAAEGVAYVEFSVDGSDFKHFGRFFEAGVERAAALGVGVRFLAAFSRSIGVDKDVTMWIMGQRSLRQYVREIIARARHALDVANNGTTRCAAALDLLQRCRSLVGMGCKLVEPLADIEAKSKTGSRTIQEAQRRLNEVPRLMNRWLNHLWAGGARPGAIATPPDDEVVLRASGLLRAMETALDSFAFPNNPCTLAEFHAVIVSEGAALPEGTRPAGRMSIERVKKVRANFARKLSHVVAHAPTSPAGVPLVVGFDLVGNEDCALFNPFIWEAFQKAAADISERAGLPKFGFRLHCGETRVDLGRAGDPRRYWRYLCLYSSFVTVAALTATERCSVRLAHVFGLQSFITESKRRSGLPSTDASVETEVFGVLERTHVEALFTSNDALIVNAGVDPADASSRPILGAWICSRPALAARFVLGTDTPDMLRAAAYPAAAGRLAREAAFAVERCGLSADLADRLLAQARGAVFCDPATRDRWLGAEAKPAAPVEVAVEVVAAEVEAVEKKVEVEVVVTEEHEAAIVEEVVEKAVGDVVQEAVAEVATEAAESEAAVADEQEPEVEVEVEEPEVEEPGAEDVVVPATEEEVQPTSPAVTKPEVVEVTDTAAPTADSKTAATSKPAPAKTATKSLSAQPSVRTRRQSFALRSITNQAPSRNTGVVKGSMKRQKSRPMLVKTFSDADIVTGWLQRMGLEDFAATLLDNGFDSFRVLALLQKQDLEEMGIKRLGDRRRILAAMTTIPNQPPALSVGQSTWI